MKFIDWLFGLNVSAEPDMLDHVPLSSSDDWRTAKLAIAAQKYGRPFKAAATSLQREVFNGDREIVVAKQGQSVPHNAPLPARTKLRAAK